ncbi:MAG: hypothetical protein NVS3B1_28230 [Marmoricola sp.]
MKPLAVIPNFVTQVTDLSMLETCLSSLRRTVGNDCDVLVVDDGSPEADLVSGCQGVAERFDCAFVAKPVNEGFSKTVNVGLRRAISEGRDAILVNADIEFTTSTWLSLMLRQKGVDGATPAAMVGALLFYPSNTIQHAGIYFSVLYREFDHIYRYAPHNLPEARIPRVGPVTGALQFIRLSTLESVGVYDESFKLGWEDVDYCVRTWLAGLEIIYQPGIRAIHHESFFRGGDRHDAESKVSQWQAASWQRFREKWSETNFAEFIPSLV